MFLVAGVDGITSMYEIEPYYLMPDTNSRGAGGKSNNSVGPAVSVKD